MGSELGRLTHWDGLVAELATAVCVTDVSGRIVIWNRAATQLYGWPAEEMFGRPLWGVLLGRADELDAVAVLTSVASGRRWTGELECTCRDASRLSVTVTLSAVYGGEEVIGFVAESRACNSSDLTEQQQLIADLRAADARQRGIVARSRDATVFFDADGTIRWASPASRELFGVAPEQLLGQNGLALIQASDQERVFTEFLSMSELGDHVRTEFRVTDLHGQVRWLEEDATNLVGDPNVGYVVGNIRDITDHKRALEQLALFALHDPLTGLPNRSLLVNRLEQLVARGMDAAVLYVDMDNFGAVNDELGHASGDELLRLVGARLAAAAAGWPSTLARAGGDEFVLLCDGVRDATAAFTYAERLRESLRPPFQLDTQEVVVTASVGVALGPGDATDLVRGAGIAMHQAKQHGGDRITIYDASLDVAQRHRLTLQSELRHALEHDELGVWYQPMIDLHTGRVAGVEALVRWNHPQRGFLGPEHFIDVAETSGLIRALGSQVLHRACADAHAWQELGCHLRISVNAAAAQLNSPDFVNEIEAALQEFALDPEQMTIEITETAVMRIADSLATLHRIRSLGLHLALDDFGTGYSSLSFLRELPIDAIKIDRAFISGLGNSERDTAIVRGVISIATAVGHAVVAEGIETAAQAATLRQLGCRYAQGFLWSQPVPATDIPDIVHRLARHISAESQVGAVPTDEAGTCSPPGPRR
jgi:diguanylate cyclase (GGDEF)-like protein/PAS domain S-box-containing protein